MNFDVFISHASEDKNDFVRELAENLRLRRIEVWYDEHSLKIGDSLRQSIWFHPAHEETIFCWTRLRCSGCGL